MDKIYGGIGEHIGMKTYLQGPYAKTPKLRLCVGGLDLPERRKRYTSSRVEEEEGVQRCPYDNIDEGRKNKQRDTIHREVWGYKI